MQFKGEEASPSVRVDQPHQTRHTGALRFVTMQCTTVCLCATGGRGKGSGVVWCISLCLHDRISYTVTEKGWVQRHKTTVGVSENIQYVFLLVSTLHAVKA